MTQEQLEDIEGFDEAFPTECRASRTSTLSNDLYSTTSKTGEMEEEGIRVCM